MVALWQSFLLTHAFGAVLASSSSTEASMNPIRKVVNLLQAMQKKVTEEGVKSEDLYNKYMCYCKTSGSDLTASISAAETKIPALTASIEASSSRKIQAEEDLKSHQVDRAAAKKSMAEATALRAKEKGVYDKLVAENAVNIAAMSKAVVALSGGLAGSFLQSEGAGVLRSLVEAKQNMAPGDRQDVLAFISGQSGEYAPGTGEIVGILSTMVDEMTADQKDVVATEKASVKAYTELMAAKKEEVVALVASIQTKMARIGDLGVQIATMKNDAGDTADSLASDEKFVGDLTKNCADKSGIHEEEKAQRAVEVVALADTIKILNDDDALELFKKTLPSASSSLIQLQGVSSSSMRSRAGEALSRVHKSARVDFILLALRGSKVGFAKVVKLVDELVATLKTEQQDDDHKKEYCAAQFDGADDKKKTLERSVSDLETLIEQSKEGVATLTQEIKALKVSISALDKSVVDATEQRKAENVEYKDLMRSNAAAKELILFAKNRLQKFYNPALHKAAPKRDLSDGDQIYVNEGGDIPTEAPGGIANTGITAFVQLANIVAPAPPPATAAAYMKKSGESGGVTAMMDLLVEDLDKEMQIAETEEKNAKEEYESTMADSADKRRQDSKTLTDKAAAKADLEGSIEMSVAMQKTTVKELMGTQLYIASLHAECDWLVQYFDVRKQARADEIDSLEKAKAVLSGADFSFVQRDSMRARKFLQK